MTRKEAFEAKYGKRGERGTYAMWDLRFLVWQAAERDMLERAIAEIEDENKVRKITIPDVIAKLKELLNG